MDSTNRSTGAEIALDSLIAQVVDEFRERRERGENPDAEEYAARHPEAADVLRRALATIQFLDDSLRSTSEGATREAPLTGTLGDFRLIREVGRGGMGIVYEAEQISLGRRVALKVLPFAATLDPRHLQRFHNEARAAASLRHEHIVPVYAVGEERGVHYFAMQFVDGQTMADLIARHRGGASTSTPRTVTTSNAVPGPAADTDPAASKCTEPAPRDDTYFRRAAEWGIQAADALEHAHSLGIVHRDIKPGNLMIDAHGKLWVADFGLARRAESDLTITGDLLGTLRYMSPEQALAKHDLVDHRSDVYSLGATLYELLTLHSAVDGNDREKILAEIIHADPKALRQYDGRIPADLETIVLKALAKEPELRYATAKELADDLRRFLSHEPVRARRMTLRQKAAKWARRNRPAVFAASIAALVTVVVLSAAAGIGYQQELDREARAKVILQIRQDQLNAGVTRLLDESDSQLKAIETKLADPIKVCELLSNIDGWSELVGKARASWQHASDLAASNQDVGTIELASRMHQMDERLKSHEADWVMAKRFDNTRLDASNAWDGNWGPFAEQYEKLFVDLGLDWKTSKPAEIAARIRERKLRYVLVAALDVWAIADMNNARGALLLEAARLADPDPWRDRVRNPKEWSGPEGLTKLAREVDVSRQSPQILQWLCLQLKDQDAALLLRSAFTQYPQDFWLHFNLENSLQNLDQRIGSLEAALAIRPNCESAHHNLGNLLLDKNDVEGAMRHYRKAIELNSKFAAAYMGLGNAWARKKEHGKAIESYDKAIDLAPKFAVFHVNLANTHRILKDNDNAVKHYLIALSLDPKYGKAHNNLANIYFERENYETAIRHFRLALEANPKYDIARRNLFQALNKQLQTLDAACRWRDGANVAKELVQLHEAQAALDATETIVAMARLGDFYRKAGMWKEGEALYDEVVNRVSAKFGPNHIKTTRHDFSRVLLISASGKERDAIPRFEVILEKQTIGLGPNDPNTLLTMASLGNAYYRVGRHQDADRVARGLVERRKSVDGPDSEPLIGALTLMGMNLVALKQYEEAEHVLHQCADLAAKFKRDDWVQARLQNLLGAALGGQGKHAKAEILLIDGYERVAKSEEKIPAPWKWVIRAGNENVVHFYESTGADEKAAAWRKKMNSKSK